MRRQLVQWTYQVGRTTPRVLANGRISGRTRIRCSNAPSASSSVGTWCRVTSPELSCRWMSTINDGHNNQGNDDAATSFESLAEQIAEELQLLDQMQRQDRVEETLQKLRSEAQRPDLWENPQHATRIVQQLGALEHQQRQLSHWQTQLDDAQELFELAQDENDQSVANDCKQTLLTARQELQKLRVKMLLNQPSDMANCFVEILAGAGGNDSCDWVAMLLEMYSRWAKHQSYQAQVVTESPAEEAGFRSVVLRIEGPYAYGYAKTEAGVHRLVRISPFDSQGRRHTSFAQVRVYPMAAKGQSSKNEIEVNPTDLRIDTYRSSGPGGQHVNTTDSAIRITHLPTGIVVQCQSDRSQHRNKAEAMEMLQAKLLQRKLDEEAQAKREFAQRLGENSWGNQIRSYILHPYQMVKDHRTNTSNGDITSVLEQGELNGFMEQMLLRRD